MLFINALDGIARVIHEINAFMRTSKHETLYRLMDWLHAYDTTLCFLPQDPNALFSNAWLCGFA